MGFAEKVDWSPWISSYLITLGSRGVNPYPTSYWSEGPSWCFFIISLQVRLYAQHFSHLVIWKDRGHSENVRMCMLWWELVVFLIMNTSFELLNNSLMFLLKLTDLSLWKWWVFKESSVFKMRSKYVGVLRMHANSFDMTSKFSKLYIPTEPLLGSFVTWIS